MSDVMQRTAQGRAWFERAARTIAMASLGVALLLPYLGEPSESGRGLASLMLRDSALLAADGREVTTALAQRLQHGAEGVRDTLRLPLPVVPSPAVRAALGVLPSAGMYVAWQDLSESRGLALSVLARSGPDAGYDVRVATGRSTLLILRDAGGALDSVVSPTLVSWQLASLAFPVQASLRGVTARAMAPATTRAKRLFVQAMPGWEGKFVIAALEEAGWLVDGQMRVAPSGTVTVGAPQRLDTARYAAAVILDSMTVDAANVARFVQQGGGLLLGGDALRIPSLAALRPVRTGAVRGAVAGALLTDTPRDGLEAWSMTLAANAQVLQRDRANAPLVVAQRHGRGRVVAVAYRETWRWRMQGTDDGRRDHREWWNALAVLAAGDAQAGTETFASAYPGDGAPYADLVARVGPPVASSAVPNGQMANVARPVRGIPRPSPALLFVIAAVALLAEWGSRRLRGLR
jgi:hypothetical protein